MIKIVALLFACTIVAFLRAETRDRRSKMNPEEKDWSKLCEEWDFTIRYLRAVLGTKKRKVHNIGTCTFNDCKEHKCLALKKVPSTAVCAACSFHKPLGYSINLEEFK